MLDFVTWTANPVLFDHGVTIRWYGLMFVIGFLIGYKIVERIFRHEGAPEKWLGTLLIYVVIATIVGARLGHVFFYAWDYYSQHPIEILYTWEGGLASHGGTIGIMIAVILFSIFVTKRSPLWTFDRFILNINQWMQGAEPIFSQPSHPTQIYEALCYLALFGVLMWMYWKRNAEKRPGLLFGVFFIWLFVGRFLIEFVKNPQEAFEVGMTLNMGQLLSIPFILLGIGLVCYACSRPPVKLEFPNKFAEEIEAEKHPQKKSKH